MGRPVSFDFTTGGGSPEEFLMGTVHLEPTLIHTIGNTVVLPDAPYPVKLVNGKAVHPDVAISPDGPEPAWAYRVTIKNEITGKAWSEFRGVPTGTTQIAYRNLPKFQESPNTPELKPTVEWLVSDYIATEPAVVNAAVEAVSDAIADSQVVTWETGKNLYDYTQDTVDFLLNVANGELAAGAGYRSSGFIPVVAGQAYTLNPARYWVFYDATKTYHSGNYADQGVQTITPAVDGYMRFAYATYAGTTLEVFPDTDVQVEKGSTATAHVPYSRIINGITVDGVSEEIQNTVDESLSEAPLVTWTPSKNLYNQATDMIDYYIIHSNGSIGPLAGYRLSDHIPVNAGQTYTINAARKVVLFDKEGAYVTGWDVSPQAVHTFTPSVNGSMRFAYTVSLNAPSTVQVEVGASPTGVVPYAKLVSGYVFDSGTDRNPLNVLVNGSELTITADHDGTALAIGANLASGANSVFNFTGTKLGATTVHPISDEPAPIRTQHGTIGANHGFALLAVWEPADHDKTTADLGSVWSSGGREFVLLGFDAAGRAFFGGDYTIDANGVSRMATITLTANLTHVSGATNTAPVDYTKKLGLGARQLYPAVQRIRQAVFVDGSPLSEGSSAGREVEVRESYEILEYASLYETAKTNIGVPHTARQIAGCVRVESVYKFTGGGVASVDVNLTEMTPTALNACGMVQAGVVGGTVTRYVPGVKAINGKDWSAGVPLASYTESQIVKLADLHNPKAPPTMTVDVRPDVAFVLGIHPWKAGVTSAQERLIEAPGNFWDLRSTKKSYPTVIMSEPAGWSRYEGHCVRAYLTPSQAAKVVSGNDAYGAWAALETVTQLI